MTKTPRKMKVNPDGLSMKHVAIVCQVSNSTIRKWCDEGMLKCYLAPSTFKFRRIQSEVLRRFMVKHELDTSRLDALLQGEL